MVNGQHQLKSYYGKPLHGMEFFFSNCMMKIYQVPMLFLESSQFGDRDEDATFIVLVFEKIIRKRAYAKSAEQKKRLARINKAKLMGARFADESIRVRESKMRRFCNYWLTVFNIKKMRPFEQFIKPEEFRELKVRIVGRIHE